MKKKLPLADLQNLPQCAADFIKLVIKKMRYHKKVRAEVMAELTAHFEDELNDCQSDEDKNKKAQKLIEEFGDAKLLSVLLRRAKKRCRSLWRTMVARGFQAVGILILLLVIYIGWFVSGKPVITTDYIAELNRMVQPVADESLNAAPFYHQAFELFKGKPEDISKLRPVDYEIFTSEEKKLVQKWVADNDQSIKLIIAGTKKPYYWEKYKTDPNSTEKSMLTILMPGLADFRRIAYALCWRAQINAEKGQYKNAFDDLLVIYRLGQHCKSGMILIEQLVGTAIEAISVITIRKIFDKHEIEPDLLAEFQKNLEKLIENENFLVNFDGEKLMGYDEIQRSFTEDKFGGGHIYPKRLLQLDQLIISGSGKKIMPVLMAICHSPIHILFTHPNKQESLIMVENLYLFFEKISCKNPGQINAENIDLDKEAMKIVKGSLILEMLIPAFSRLNEMSHRLKSDIQATITIIAILRYKQQNGSYPENLKELTMAGLLKKLPIDAYSNKPLVYRKTKGDFILYSISENFIDDGGVMGKDSKGNPRVWANNGDAVFWPVRK
ncbi:MAG: hypothetical protein ACYSSI_03710 [Planctomycetota bacterium]|jgi:hypothetical protein